jgi:hypothetical protein
VTYEPIQTVEHVRAVANYGPTATLFTLGPNHSIQQYDLETGEVVANTQHFPMTVPPTPPEEKQQFEYLTSSSTEDLTSPAGKSSAQEMFEAARQARIQMGSPQSYQSRESEKSGALQARARHTPVVSPSGRTEQSVTNISVGTQSRMAPSAYGQPQQPNMSQYSPVSNRGRKGSRLKQEVLPSPETTPILDLFPYTRARLNDVPYKPVRPGDEANLSTDSLRRQMLEVVFGWEQDASELVRDELSRHPPASQNAILLAKWLNDDPEHMSNILGSSGMSSQLDWMMLALSGMGNHAASKKMGLNFVEKKLREGDIHAAAIILLTLGDRNDAIEVYLEANYYLEAVLLTCLLMPNDWGRLKHLVRKWGEYVVDKSQQYLAIRCFSCTDVEPAGEWTSPTAQLAASKAETVQFPQQPAQMHSDIPSEMQRRNFFTAPTPIAMMKPQTPMSLDPHQQQAQRGPLRLITSFGAQEHHILKFPGLKSDDRTPTVGHGVTPIAESAINESALTPGGAGSYRLNNMRSINSALLSGRTATPGAFHRQRLPSIGETPIDSNPPQFPLNPTPVNVPKALPTPADSGSEKEKEKAQERVMKLVTDDVPPVKEEKPTLTLSSARYEPSEPRAKETPLTAVAPSTAVKFSRHHDLKLDTVAPPPPAFEEKKPRSRGGSRSRKPDGLSIQMIPVHEREQSDRSETTGDSPAYRSLHRSNTLNSNTTTQFDTHSEMTSPPTTGNSYYDPTQTTESSFRNMTKSPSVTGRSIDQYISSLEQAQYYTKGPRSRTNGSQDGADRTPRKKSKNRDREDDRGRNERRAIPSSKRSPSSPVPMSPDDLSLYTAPSIESFDSIFEGEKQMEAENRRMREEKKSTSKKPRSESRHEERQRHRSRSRHGEGRSKPASVHVSRRTTPEPFGDPYARGRSASKLEGSTTRSPSSPLPMTSSMEDLRTPIEGPLRLVSRNRERRDRSSSRRADRGTSSRREASPDRRKREGRSGSRKTSGDGPADLPLSRRGSVSTRVERHRRRAPSNEKSGKHDREPSGFNIISPSMYDSSVYSSIAPEDSISQISTVDPEYRTQSNPQILDRRKKELAAAELEARRLSLARRPSAPSIPLPGQHNLHGKSASTDATLTLARSKTDLLPTLSNINSYADRIEARNSPRAPASDSGSSGKGSNGPRRQGTPRAMRHPMQDSSIPDIPEGMATLLGSESYRPTRSTDPVPRSISAPPEKDPSIRVTPSDLPKHPAFDMRIPNSRSSSKTDENRRAISRERGTSKDRKPHDPVPPPILPELQHLAMPPAPPPAPPPPSDLRILTAFTPPIAPSTAPVPHSEPPSASTHRRGRSGNESTGMFNGLRNLADRMRSTSRGRDARSPPMEDTVSPYESIPLPPNFHQRVAAQTRSPVIPEEGVTLAMSPYESLPDGPPVVRGMMG